MIGSARMQPRLWFSWARRQGDGRFRYRAEKRYYFPDLAKKQSIGKWNEPDYEMIGEIGKGGEEAITLDIMVIGYSYPDKPYGIFGVEKGLAPFNDIKAVALEFTKPET